MTCPQDCGLCCNNGNLDPGEQCDPPGDTSQCPAGGVCSVSCACPPLCGDDFVAADETCDPPGSPAGGNGNLCRGDCTVCGDGFVDTGEACDDANGTDGDGCDNDCRETQPRTCGSGRAGATASQMIRAA